MTPVSPTAVLLYLAAVSTFLFAMRVAVAIDIYDGYTKTLQTYNDPTTFTFNSLIGYYRVSSTATISSSYVNQLVTIDGVGLPAPQTYITSLYMLWDRTTLNKAGGWKLVASLPNAHMHFLSSNGYAKSVPFLTLEANFEQNTTVFVENTDVRHAKALEAVSLIRSNAVNSMYINGHSIVHIRGLLVSGLGYLLKTSEHLQIGEESQLYMDHCTARVGSHSLFNFRTISISDHSALILHDITGIYYLSTMGDTTVDETSVLSFIDVDIRGGDNLFDVQGTLSFRGAGTFVWIRILTDGWSGMISKEPQNNKKFWVSMKVKDAILTDSQLSATGSRQNAFNVNTNNKMDWRGTYPGTVNCVPVGLAIEGRGEYILVEGSCFAMCKSGYRGPACTKAPAPCAIGYCETCTRSTRACLVCNTSARLPSVPNAERCDCIFPFCANCPKNNVCSECMTSYKLSDDKKNCFKCALPNCEQCSYHDKCSRCVTGYKLSKTDGKCYKCTMENCEYCSLDEVCAECAEGHKPGNENKDCFLCTMPNCIECSMDNVCKACKDGFKLSEIDGNCYECTVDNCKYCSADGVCGKCADSHKPTNGNTECFLCPMHQCTECSADNLCKECAPGFKPSADEGSCYVCSGDNCARCGTENDCQACDDGYTLTKDKRCVSCNLDNCQRCDVSDVCALCDDQHTVTNSGACVACGVGNCTSCSSASTCAICACGMVPANKGKKCVECTVSNCRYCDVSGDGKKCAECAERYALTSEGTCKAIAISSPIVFLIVVTITIALVAAICVSVSFYVFNLARQGQMERTAEERRRTRQAMRPGGRQRLDISILDLGDLELAASGVRDELKTITVMQ